MKPSATVSQKFATLPYEVAPHITDMPVTMFWAGLGHDYNRAVLAEAEALLDRFQATIGKWKTMRAAVPVEDKETLANLMRSEIYDKLDLSTYGLQ